MSVVVRHNITESGVPSGQPVVFGHGFGCDQNMWRFVAPAFADRYRVVLFDHVGAGNSDLSAYDPDRYASLHGYADDVVTICRDLDLRNPIFIGHSASATIGMLAAIAEPGLFDKLVLVAPSPRYVDDAGYVGGFSEADIAALLDALDSNYLGWSSAMAPAIMGNPDRPELAAELTNSFCRTDPDIARQFARVCFLSDHRADLDKVTVRCLVLQCSDDLVAPTAVGTYVHDRLPDSKLVHLAATGHCPHLSAPEETIAAIEGFL